MKFAVLPVLMSGLVLLAGCALAPAAPSPAGGAPPAASAAPSAAPLAATATAMPRPATAAPTTAPATLAPTSTAAPATAAPTAAPASPAAQPTVPPGFTTHHDPVSGFAIDYPARWSITATPVELRRDAVAYSASLRSVSPQSAAPRGQALPAGATGIDVTVSKTKATTFEEMVRERRDEIANSETEVKIASEDFWTLAGGLRAVRWQIESPMAGTVAELSTLLGGKRVLVAGMGDLSQFDAVARTLRAELPSAGGQAAAAAPAGARVYDGGKLRFTLLLLPDWEQCQETDKGPAFCLKQAVAVGPAFPRFYVTVLPAGFTNADASAYNFLSEAEVRALMGLTAGQSYTTSGTPGYSTFTRLPDTTVSGLPGVVIENAKVWEGGPATRDRRVLVKVGTSTYMFGTYYETAGQLAEFERVLAGVNLS